MKHSSDFFQPVLKNKLVLAEPLLQTDFEQLYLAASDPLIWEQHPNKNRWQLNAFENYFDGAMKSGGAFLVKDAATHEVIGSSRYSDYEKEANTVSIGYTFFIRSHWGKGYNYALKQLMLDHIFQYVDIVRFYIGAVNKRSQISIERFGAIKTGKRKWLIMANLQNWIMYIQLQKSNGNNFNKKKNMNKKSLVIPLHN